MLRSSQFSIRATEVSENENIKFDVICGDFNIDNLSPCDELAGQNLLFSDYCDHAAITSPGEEKVRQGQGDFWLFLISSL